MQVVQWSAFAVLLAIFAALAFLFIRHGTKIKPDPENKGRSDPPGSSL